MPYSNTTLAQLISQISDLLDDPTQKYWTSAEIQAAVYEGLLYWGALTGYWRTQGAIPATQYGVQFAGPAWAAPYIDLSVALPTLRTRNYTLGQLVKEIQWMLLESPSGVAGTGMSGQVDVQSILTCLQDARNRFVIDTHLPISYNPTLGGFTPDGLVTLPDTTVYLHRASWMDSGGKWTPLWREDSYAADRANPSWTVSPDSPVAYSESELSPLTIQLIPRPINTGVLDGFTVDSLTLDLTSDSTLLGLPDEWVHAVKYATVAQILSSTGQITDQLRSQYAEQRYKQSVEFAKEAMSVIRVQADGVPLPTEPLSRLDTALPTWLNQYGAPVTAGVLYDWLALAPGQLDYPYGLTVDVVQVAPLPGLGDHVQLGNEEFDGLKSYVVHILCFKCGGKDFTSTMGDYDDFMSVVGARKGVNRAKIKYLEPMFSQPLFEYGIRPDKVADNA